MKLISTPTYKSVGAALFTLAEEIDDELRNSDKPLGFARLNDMAETICLLIGDEKEKLVALSGFTQGLIKLQEAAYHSPESARGIAHGAQQILIAMCNIALVIANDRMEIEVARMAPLARKNKTKEVVIRLARAQARQFWAADTRKEIRTKEMAEKVYKAMLRLGFDSYLPGEADRLKEWIKPDAPAYAQKGGRRKTSRT